MPHRLLPRLPLFLLAAVTAVAAAGCDTKADQRTGKDQKPPLVRAVPAVLRMVRREIDTVGFLESEQQDQVASLVSGRLAQLHADEGAVVPRGALLAEVDDRQAQLAIDQLTVQRDGKQVDKELAELEVEAAGRRLAQMRIEAQKAKAEFDRQSQIDKEFVSPKALQDAELVYQGAGELVKLAEFNERKSRLEVTRIANTVAELDSRLRDLRVQLEHHRVTAPFTGIISKRHVVAGGTVATGTVLFDMIDPDHLVAWLNRPQAELDLVRQAKQVRFTTDALPGREFTGDVDLVSPVIDRQTGQFRLRMRVQPDDARTLVHGMFVRARIMAESEREALMVPKAAVLSEGDVSVVMVVRDGKAMRIDLDPGLELATEIECKNLGSGGVRAGDLVIVAGHEDLQDQTTVTVSKE